MVRQDMANSDENEINDGSRLNRRTFLKGSAVAVGLSAVPAQVGATTHLERETPDDPQQVSTATGSDGMVSTSDPRASRVGASVLEEGGNAIDAAAAIQTALNVVEPHASGIGGSSYVLIYSADDDRVYCLNNQVRAPLEATRESFFDDDGELLPDDQIERTGLGVGVPGTLRGLDVALKRWGTWSLGEVIDPAIPLAERGHEVSRELARALNNSSDVLSNAAQDVFCTDGEPLTKGDLLVQKDLADTLRLIRDQGIEVFYQGEIAEAIAEIVQETGGHITVRDLNSYNNVVKDPVSANYEGLRVASMPPPSSGGITMLTILKLLEEFDLHELDPRSPDKYHLLTEAFNLAYAPIYEYLGDPQFVDVPIRGLLDDEFLDQRRELIDFESTNTKVQPGNPWEFQPGTPYEITSPAGMSNDTTNERTQRSTDGKTTHFTTADNKGNIVSYTSTISFFFGTGIMVPEYGFMLNNSGKNFDFEDPGANNFQPYKQPLSTMTPTIVFENGEPVMTIGSPHGARIWSTVAQFILNNIEFGMNIAEATAEPRIHSSSPPGVGWEEGVPEEVREQLEQRGHEWSEDPTVSGDAQSMLINQEENRYIGAADPRRGGLAIGLSEGD